MTTAKRVAKNVFSLISGSVINNIIFFFVTAYIARKLGVSNFGMLAFSMMFVNYFGLLPNLGMNTLATREIARDLSLTRKYCGSIIAIKIILSIIAFVLLLIVLSFLRFPYTKNIVIIVYGLTIFVKILNLGWIFNAHEKMQYSALQSVTEAVFYALGIFLILSSINSVVVVPFTSLGALLISGIAGLIIFFKKYGFPELYIDFKYWKKFILTALPIGLSVIMMQFYYSLDTVMLSFMKGDEAVGYYNAAFRIAFFLMNIIGFYYAAIFPILSQRYKNSISELKSICVHSLKLGILLALPLSIGGIILAEPIIGFIFGLAYLKSALAFKILIVNVTIVYLLSIYGYGLLACDKQKEFLKAEIFAVIVNILFNLMLIPYFSLYGAAIATVFSRIISGFIVYNKFQLVIRLSFIKYLIKPLIASLIMGIIILFLREWNLIILIMTGVVVYSIMLFALKGISKSDILLMKSLFVK